MDRNIFEEEHEMFRDSVRSFMKNEIGRTANTGASKASSTARRF